VATWLDNPNRPTRAHTVYPNVEETADRPSDMACSNHRAWRVE
jgi:hypothetical protein